MMAYLSMMAPRLLEMRRVLKDTGSIYLHCDPTASHYLKLLMDAVFGSHAFQNEIIWQKIRASKGQTRGFGAVHDTIFAYRKSDAAFFQRQYVPLEQHRIDQHYSQIEPSTGRRYMLDNFTQAGAGGPRRFGDRIIAPPSGKHWIWTQEHIDVGMEQGRLVFTSDNMVRVKRYLEESHGNPVEDIWTDIFPINSQSAERLGYPTQKPEALLKRIIKASSNEGDLILDPFCGCGTTIAVAQSQGRMWIGIDITYLAIDVIKKRFEKNRIQEGIDFEIDGEPTDVYSAEKLAKKDPFQFQLWCVSKLDATPTEIKTGDQGVDGIINFIDLTKRDEAGKGIIQVKGTQTVTPDMVRSLKGTIKSQNADFGILITLKKATHGMVMEAVKNGYAESTKKFPKIQLLTIEDLFKKPIPITLPGQILPPYKKPDIKKEQKELF